MPELHATAAVDGARGFIVDCDVIDVPKENGVFLESMDWIAENFEVLLAGVGGRGHGHDCEFWRAWKRGRWILHAGRVALAGAGHPPCARIRPFPEADWPASPQRAEEAGEIVLPLRRKGGLLSLSAGKILLYDESKKSRREGGEVTLRIYRCMNARTVR